MVIASGAVRSKLVSLAVYGGGTPGCQMTPDSNVLSRRGVSPSTSSSSLYPLSHFLSPYVVEYFFDIFCASDLVVHLACCSRMNIMTMLYCTVENTWNKN